LNGQGRFGESVAISGDTIVVGAYYEASGETEITNGATGYSNDNSYSQAGTAYVFVRAGTTWAAQAYLKAPNAGAQDQFGYSLATSGDTIVVGAHAEASSQITITNAAAGHSTDNSAANAGAVYVFVRADTTWAAQSYLKAPNAGGGDYFGRSVAVSGDTIVVGAYAEDSSQTAITNGATGYSTDNSALDAGAAYVFKLHPAIVAGTPGKLRLTGGVGLALAPGQDSAKVVASTATCSESSGGGTSEVTDLGPNDSSGGTSAGVVFTFTTPGAYKVCYKLGSMSYAQVGSGAVAIAGVTPTGFTDDGSVNMGTTETVTFTSGAYMNLGSGADSAKAVAGNGTCADGAAGGTSEVTDLGPDDSTGATA
jgi:hypothetical protein